MTSIWHSLNTYNIMIRNASVVKMSNALFGQANFREMKTYEAHTATSVVTGYRVHSV